MRPFFSIYNKLESRLNDRVERFLCKNADVSCGQHLSVQFTLRFVTPADALKLDSPLYKGLQSCWQSVLFPGTFPLECSSLPRSKIAINCWHSGYAARSICVSWLRQQWVGYLVGRCDGGAQVLWLGIKWGVREWEDRRLLLFLEALFIAVSTLCFKIHAKVAQSLRCPLECLFWIKI